ncbi:MAG: hypothetical protein JRJ87_09365 [Deltaproteobacteria bacterium]|nr:hypothetical protein [Deltaproteobacteria bacterium]
MHPKNWVIVLIVGLLVVMTSCGTRVVIIRGGPPPAWVDRLPSKPGKLCAVGYSGPTFYQQDCLGNAAENARGHLAETISVTIRTITIDISDGTRGSFSKDVFVQGSESAANAVLQGSEIEAQWMDLQGQRGSSKGCYAYVCIDPDKPIDKMIETLEEKNLPPKTVEKVRANAEAAFDELEKLEDEKALEKTPPPPPPKAEEDQPEETAPDGGTDKQDEAATPAEDKAAPEAEEKPTEEKPAEDTKTESGKSGDSIDATNAVRKIEIPSE